MAKSLSTEQLEEVTLITGMQKNVPASFKTTIAGQSYTLNQLVGEVQSRITARSAVTTAKGALKETLAAYDSTCTSTQALLAGLRQALIVMYANTPSVLADMGLHARKSVKTTVADKSAAIAKRSATRALRHTLGAKQKEAIKAADAPAGSNPPAFQPTLTPSTPTTATSPKV
jgi:hypothetical protein